MNRLKHAVRQTIGLACLRWTCSMAPMTPVAHKPWAATTIAIISIIVSVTIAVASAAVQYQQAQAAAEQQARQQKAMMAEQDRVIAQNAALANRSYMDQTKQTQERQRQADEVAAMKEMGVAKDAAEARSAAVVAAGEAGVSGMAVQALLSDFTRQEADYRMQSRVQLGYEHAQTEAELRGLQAQAEGRIQSEKSYQPKPTDYPSKLGLGLQIGGAIGQGAYSYYSQRPATPTTTRPNSLSLSDRVRQPY
jgi:hypothetical protein